MPVTVSKVNLTLSPNLEGLFHFYDLVCQEEGISRESTIIINQLLERIECEPAKSKRRKIDLTDNTIKKIKKEANPIAGEIDVEFKPREIDGLKGKFKSKARYLVEAALMSFDCYRDGKKLDKYEIDKLLGFSARTMRVQQQIYLRDLLNKETNEYKIYQNLRCKFKQYSTFI